MKKLNPTRLLVWLLALCLVLCVSPAVFAANDLVVEAGDDVTIESTIKYDSITVTGGKLTVTDAKLDLESSGSKTITISGGEVVLTDAVLSTWGSVTINISGGTITGIGEFAYNDKYIDPTQLAAGAVNISGGIIQIPAIVTYSGRLSINGNTAIFVESLRDFSDSSIELTGSDYTFTKGILMVGNSGTAKGQITLPGSVTIQSGMTLNFVDGASITNPEMMTIEEGATILVDGQPCSHKVILNNKCLTCGLDISCDLYVDGKPVTEENTNGDGWEFTPATDSKPATLVLENAVLGGSQDTTFMGSGIYHIGQDALVIELKGESTVTGTEVTEESETGLNAYGALHSGGTLTIQGSGTLNALGYYGDNMDNRFVFPGIYTRDLLTISGGTINTSGNVGILVGEHDLISKLVVSGGTITSTVIPDSQSDIPANLAVLGMIEISGGTTTLNGGAIPLVAMQVGHMGFPHTIHLTGGSLYLHPDKVTMERPFPLFLGSMDLSGYRNYRWTNQEDGPWYFSTPLDTYYGDLLKIEPSPYVQAPAPSADNHYALDVTGLSGDETLTYTWFHAEESSIDTDGDSKFFLIPAQEGDLVRIQVNSMEDFPNSYFAVGDAITGTNCLAVLSDNVWIHRVEAADLVTDNGTAYFPVLCARLDPKGDMWDSNLHTDVTITRIRTLDQVEGQTGRNLQAPEAGKYIGMVSLCENGTTLATAVTDVVDYVPYSHTGGAATCNQGKVCQVCSTLYDTTLDPKNHVQVDETGLCACGEQMIASLTLDGVTTYYTDGYAFQKALVDLPDPSVYSVEIYRDLSTMDFGGCLNFLHGTAQLDLNGFTLDVTLILDDMNMTVIDSSNGKGTIINDGGYAFYILSGKLTLDASTDCLGTGEGHEAWRILNMTEGQLALGTDIILPEDYLLVNTKTDLPVTSLAVGEMGFPHIHSLSSDYAFDDIQHWQNCTGCDEMLNVQKHSILDIMVGNEQEHWNTCVNCDVVLNKGDHTGGAANCTVPGSCTTCKQVYQNIDADKHDFVEGVCTLCGEPDPNYAPPQPEAPSVKGLTRLAGKDRLITSYLVADQLKAQMNVEKFDAVIVASGKTFADALPGSYLAAAKNAPILLTLAKDQYIKQTADYVKANLKAGGTVYILGGESAVPASMDAALAGFKVQRVAGADRFKTNLEILKVGGAKSGDEILVCEGKGYADSLSASATGKPILLVYKKLTAEQKAYLAALKNCSFTIVGGTTAVPENIAKEIEAYGTVTRLAGKDRLDTSILVANKYFKGAATAVVAYGWDFPDGLCGGPLANEIGAPLILAHSKEKLYTFTADKTNLTAGYVLGGDGLVSDVAVKAIFGATGINVIK